MCSRGWTMSLQDDQLRNNNLSSWQKGICSSMQSCSSSKAMCLKLRENYAPEAQFFFQQLQKLGRVWTSWGRVRWSPSCPANRLWDTSSQPPAAGSWMHGMCLALLPGAVSRGRRQRSRQQHSWEAKMRGSVELRRGLAQELLIRYSPWWYGIFWAVDQVLGQRSWWSQGM